MGLNMVSFFKKKTTASELGIALLQNVTCSDLSSVLNSLNEHVGKYRQRVHDELVYLLVFVVDYAVTMSLGNDSPEKNAIFNAYYYHLQEMAKKGEFCADFYSTLYNERLPIYTNAVNTPHKNGVVYAVAAKFSELCVYHTDILLITAASSLFSGQFQSISEIFKTWEIIV
jgi:hypothetical protein